MTAHQYLRSVLARYSLTEGDTETAKTITGTIRDMLGRAYGPKIDDSSYLIRCHRKSPDSTALDIDIAVHFEHHSFRTVKEMYDSLYDLLWCFYDTAKKRSSISVRIDDHTIDMIPVRLTDKTVMSGEIYDMYRGRSLRTNILRQWESVERSVHGDAVRLMRIWKYRNGVEARSFFLELIAVNVLSDFGSERLDDQVVRILECLRDDIDDIVLTDPGNTGNDIARTLSPDERRALSKASSASLEKTRWMDIVW